MRILSRPAASVVLALAAVLAACAAPTRTTPRETSAPATTTPGTSAPATPAAGGSPLASSTTPGISTPLVVVTERCAVSECHPIGTVKKAAPRSRAAWLATVRKMQRDGAQVTNAEAQRIAVFLAAGGQRDLP